MKPITVRTLMTTTTVRSIGRTVPQCSRRQASVTKGCPDSDGDAWRPNRPVSGLYGESYSGKDGCPDTDGDGFDAERNWTFEDVLTGSQRSPRSGETAMEMVSATTKRTGDDCKSAPGRVHRQKWLSGQRQTAIQTKATRAHPIRKTTAGLPSLTIPQKYWKRKAAWSSQPACWLWP